MRKLFSLFSILLTTMAVLTTQSMFFNTSLQDGGAASSWLSKINQIAFDNIPALQNNKELQNVMKNMPLSPGASGAANPTTVIRFNAPEAGLARIKIYHISGRLVRSESHYTAYAGKVEFIWDGKDDFGKLAADGQYFYQVRCGERILTKRTAFVKVSR